MEEHIQYKIIPLAERIENAYKSDNGLYPHEIIVLYYASKYSKQGTYFHTFWLNRYGIRDVRKILDKLFERGFIKYASVKETVKHQSIPDIKDFLKNNGIKVSGNKKELIERIFENISEEETEHYFPDRYYELTELGTSELERNQMLIYIHNKPFNDIDIWKVNKWMHQNPNTSILDVILEKINNDLEYLLNKKDYAMYLNKLYGVIQFNMDNKRWDIALNEIAHQIYFEVNAAKVSQSESFIEYYIEDVFPYSSSMYKLSSRVKTILANIKHLLNLDNDEIVDLLINFVDDVELSFEMFDKRECALIALYDMRNEINKIEEKYIEVEARVKDKCSSSKNMFKKLSEKEQIMIAKKEQILLDSFNILKNDIKTNHEQIAKIMVQLQESQPETVVELWKYLLEENWNYVVNDTEIYSSIATYLTSDLMKVLTYDVGFITFEKYFVSEPQILQAVYQYSPELLPWSTSVIATQIKSENFETANMMLEYMYANKKNNFIKNDNINNYCFSNIYKDWIENYITTSRTHYGAGTWRTNLKVSDDIFDFLSYWVNQIKDSHEKARTNVFLMELI